MAIATIIYIFLFLVPAALAASYYFGLMLARFLGASSKWPTSDKAQHHFAIIIPAHNEENAIAETLESCQQIDYPEGKLDIYVLADNCTDRTAEIARRHGVQCLERQDADNPGKGQALAWAFPQVLASSCDAVVVIDADCVVDSHAMRVFDYCLTAGNLVLQANYVMSNPDASAISYVARIGNVTEYNLFYAPKSDLGLSVTLVGTGMVFHRTILEQYPWQATSVTEDVEYTLSLLQAGVRVHFVSNVGVHQAAAERIDQLLPQRKRWAQGTLGLGRRQSFALMLKGLSRGNIRLIDFGWTLVVLSRPLVLVHLLTTVVLGGLLSLFANDPIINLIFSLSLLVLAIQVAYFIVGIVMVGASWHRLKLLCTVPFVGMRLVGISVVAATLSRDIKWERTPR